MYRVDSMLKNRFVLNADKYVVENTWVQSRLVEGRLVVLAVRRGTAPL
jgi:hypothetical protein